MKRILSVLILGLLVAGSLFAQGNLLVNADLETLEPNFWSTFGEGATMTWCTDGYDGSLRSFKIEKAAASAAMAGWVSDNNAKLYWNNAPADGLYNLTFRVKTVGVNTAPATDDEKIGVKYEFKAGGNVLAEKIVYIDQTAADLDWTEVTDGVATAGGTAPDEITVSLFMGKDATGAVYFDNVDCGTDPWSMGIFNGNAETPKGWMEWHSGDNPWNYSNLDDTYAHSGTYSALLRERDDEGDEMVFYSEPVAAEANKWYEISVWVKWDSVNVDPNYIPSNIVTQKIDDRMNLCFFYHRAPLMDSWELTGGDQFFYFDQRDSSSGDDWVQYHVISQAPEDAAGLSVRARFNNTNKGYCWYDDFSVEEIEFDPNLMVNADLETLEPNFWTPFGDGTMTWSTDGYDGSLRSFKIEKAAATAAMTGWVSDNNAKLYWNNAPADGLFNLTFRVKTVGVNTAPATDDEKIGVKYEFKADGTTKAEKIVYIDQTAADMDWTEVTDGVAVAGDAPDEIIVSLFMGKDAIGAVYFDNVDCGTDPWSMGIFNGNAEIPLGWMEWHSGDNPLNYSNLDDTYAHSGTYSALLRERDDEGDEMVFYSEPVPAEPNEWYEVSVWAKWDSVNVDPDYIPSNVIGTNIENRMGICFFFHRAPMMEAWDLTGGDQFFYFDQRDSSSGENWVQFKVKAKAPEDAAGISARARFNPTTKGYCWYDDFSIRKVNIMTSPVDDSDPNHARMPVEFDLAQNYPNPFNPTTHIGFMIQKATQVELTVYNVMGQKVRTLVNEVRPAGSYLINWDGRNESGNVVNSGVYFYQLRTENSTVTKRMTFVK